MNETLPVSIKTATFHAALAEAMAYGKYTILASFCKELGYHSNAMLLSQLANNEKEHLELILKELHMLPEDIDGILKSVLQSELNDGNEMYPKLEDMISNISEVNESLHNLQDLSRRLGAIERHHADLIKHAIAITQDPENVEEPPAKWVCTHCGNTVDNFDDISDECPVCKHSKADYILAY